MAVREEKLMRAKGLIVLGLALLGAFARADITFSNIDATVTFDGTDEFDLAVNTNGFEIDFSALDMPIYIDNVNSDFTSAVVNISYEADTTDGDVVNQLDLIFSGWTLGGANISFREVVFDDTDTEIASVSGNISGETPFVQSDILTFEGQTSYRVEKTFTLTLGNGGEGGGPSLASMGLVEQNAVPEPATMGALAVGALGLLARKRRK
jgi:hypothetical protein